MEKDALRINDDIQKQSGGNIHIVTHFCYDAAHIITRIGLDDPNIYSVFVHDFKKWINLSERQRKLELWKNLK